MPKLAILNSVSFDKKSSFDYLKEDVIEKYLSDKVEFRDFDNEIGMHRTVQDVFGEGSDVDPMIIHYDDKHFIQGFVSDDEGQRVHENIILVKREILDDDKYLPFQNSINDVNIFKFLDMTMLDIIKIVQRKSLVSCVVVKHNEGNMTMHNDSLLILKGNDDVGKVILKSDNMEKVYLNLSNIVHQTNPKKDENDDETNEIKQKQTDEIVMQKINAYCAKYLYGQFNTGMGVANCIYDLASEYKNEFVSDLIKHDMYGDVIIYMESNFEDENREMLMDLNCDLLKKIHDVIKNNKRIMRKNPYFLNIYKEINN